MIRLLFSPGELLKYSLEVELQGKLGRFSLKPGEQRSGISRDADIRLEGAEADHALVVIEDEGAWIQDLGSEGKTYVNGEPIGESVWLQAGDRIDLGPKLQIRFLAEGNAPKRAKTAEEGQSKPKRRWSFGRILLFGFLAVLALGAGLFAGFRTGVINPLSLVHLATGAIHIEVLNLAEEPYLAHVARYYPDDGDFSKVDAANLDEFASFAVLSLPGTFRIEFYQSTESDPYFIEDAPFAICTIQAGRGQDLFFTILEPGVLVENGEEYDNAGDYIVGEASVCEAMP